MQDDGTLRRWFGLEMNRMLETLVPRPRPLSELLLEREPSAPTRGGEPHLFDPVTLRRVAAQLSPLTRSRLRLPFTFHLDNETPGDAYVADPAAIDALRELGLLRTQARDGRGWVSLPLAREFAQRHPTLAQFAPR